MKNSFVPKIEEFEFKDRRQRLRFLMEKNEIDVVIAYADDKATFGQQFSRYYFNYQPHFEPACVIIPLNKSSFIVTGPESEEFVYKNSYCKDVKIADVFTHPNEEYPFHKILSFSDLLLDFSKNSKKSTVTVGIAGSEMLPYKYWQKINNLNFVKVIEVDDMILQQRSIKSPQEIKVIEHAYSIAERGIKKGIEVIDKGISEREIAAEIEYEMRKLGSEGMGIDTIIGSGKNNTHPILTRTTARKIKKGDHVLLTIAPRYEGYHGAIGRVVAIGQINENISEAYNIALKAQEEVIKNMRPGIKGFELDKIARDVCISNNYGKYFAYSGIHSVGVCEFEPPIMTSWNKIEIIENMILSIDIPLFFLDWGGIRIEDGFKITNSSNSALQNISKNIFYK